MNRISPYLLSIITPVFLLGHLRTFIAFPDAETQSEHPATIHVKTSETNELPKSLRVLKDTVVAADTMKEVIVPVELIRFSADWQHQTVLLSWQTASELNADQFEVLHSTDGMVWTLISVVQASGNSNELRDYSTVHSQPANNTNYYRLIQRDHDGTVHTDEKIAVWFHADRPLNVYPNPLTGELLEVHTELNGHLAIYNHLGELLDEIDLVEGVNKVYLPHIPSGVYFLRTGDNTQQTIRIQKH